MFDDKCCYWPQFMIPVSDNPFKISGQSFSVDTHGGYKDVGNNGTCAGSGPVNSLCYSDASIKTVKTAIFKYFLFYVLLLRYHLE